MAGTTSAAVTIQAVGDMVVCWATTGLAGQTITSISDTNTLVGWQQLVFDNEIWGSEHVAMWWGIATGTGATTVTPTYTAGAPTFAHCAVDEWSGAQNWVAGTPGVTGSGSLVATLTYPNLSPISEPSVYLGYVIASATFSNTATSGFTSSRSGNAEIASNPGVTIAGSPYAPTSAATTTAAYNATGAIFSSAIIVPTPLSYGNYFYQQNR